MARGRGGSSVVGSPDELTLKSVGTDPIQWVVDAAAAIETYAGSASAVPSIAGDQILSNRPGTGTVLLTVASIGGSGNVNVVTKTAAFTATATNDVILCDTTTAAFAITLPAAAAMTKALHVKKTAGANAVTLTPPAGTIDGAASVVIAIVNQSVTVISDGTNFYVI